MHFCFVSQKETEPCFKIVNLLNRLEANTWVCYTFCVVKRACESELPFSRNTKEVMRMKNVELLSILLSIFSLVPAAFSLGMMMR